MLSYFKKLLTLGAENLPLEDRLLRISSLVIAILILPTFIMNYAMGMPWEVNAVLAPTLIFYGYLLWYTGKNPITNTLRLWFFLAAVLVMFPLWFLNGGVLGTMVPFLFLLFLMGSYIGGRDNQRQVVIIYFSMLLLFFGLEFMYPEWAIPHQSEEIKKYDNISGIVLASGAIAALVVSFRLSYIKERDKLLDIQNELRNANKALIEARNQSESANRTKSAFLANMSHEIRTPLNSIIGAIDLIQGSKMTNEQEALVSLMEESSGNLLQLLTDILDLSKIEAKKISIKFKPVDLNNLKESMVSFGNSMIVKASKSLQIEGSLSPDVAPFIKSDPTRITQIITNLISNAVKYSDEGCIRLHIYSRQSEGQDRLVIEVSDEGIGIKPEDIELIYQPFSQVSGKQTHHLQGVGLGLAITKSILSMMQGHLELESELGKGSTFRAILPYEPVEAPLQPTEIEVDYRGTMAGKKILLVEDNKINQIIITKMIQELGAEASLAMGGLQALELLNENTYDCILMDLNMPGIDGIETTHRLRSMPGMEQQLVIAVTANVLAKDEQRCIDAGLNGYLSKPLTIASLGAKLSEVLIEAKA